MVHIPPKPKNDAEFLEVTSKIIFISGFRWNLVNSRWPKIKKAFHNFDVNKVASEKIDNILENDGMIKNKAKINAIIENAKLCRDIIKKHGSVMRWIKEIQIKNRKGPLLNPTVAEEMKKFEKIGNTTGRWLAYVVTRDKRLVED